MLRENGRIPLYLMADGWKERCLDVFEIPHHALAQV
jgi:hypothetical protein